MSFWSPRWRTRGQRVLGQSSQSTQALFEHDSWKNVLSSKSLFPKSKETKENKDDPIFPIAAAAAGGCRSASFEIGEQSKRIYLDVCISALPADFSPNKWAWKFGFCFQSCNLARYLGRQFGCAMSTHEHCTFRENDRNNVTDQLVKLSLNELSEAGRCHCPKFPKAFPCGKSPRPKLGNWRSGTGFPDTRTQSLKVCN